MDLYLREFERKSHQGDPDAELALLRNKLRTGRARKLRCFCNPPPGSTPVEWGVPQDMMRDCCDNGYLPPSTTLDLLVWCFHAPAWKLADNWIHSDHIAGICRCADCILANSGFVPWAQKFKDWGPEVMIRVAAAICAAVHPSWEATGSKPPHMSCMHMSCMPGCRRHAACIHYKDLATKGVNALCNYVESPDLDQAKICGGIATNLGGNPTHIVEALLLVHWPPIEIHLLDPMYKKARFDIMLHSLAFEELGPHSSLQPASTKETTNAICADIINWALTDE